MGWSVRLCADACVPACAAWAVRAQRRGPGQRRSPSRPWAEPEGVEQARALGGQLSAVAVRRDRSRSFRASLQTADVALEGRDVPRIVDEDLGDIRLGELEGATVNGLPLREGPQRSQRALPGRGEPERGGPSLRTSARAAARGATSRSASSSPTRSPCATPSTPRPAATTSTGRVHAVANATPYVFDEAGLQRRSRACGPWRAEQLVWCDAADRRCCIAPLIVGPAVGDRLVVAAVAWEVSRRRLVLPRRRPRWRSARRHDRAAGRRGRGMLARRPGAARERALERELQPGRRRRGHGRRPGRRAPDLDRRAGRARPLRHRHVFLLEQAAQELGARRRLGDAVCLVVVVEERVGLLATADASSRSGSTHSRSSSSEYRWSKRSAAPPPRLFHVAAFRPWKRT